MLGGQKHLMNVKHESRSRHKDGKALEKEAQRTFALYKAFLLILTFITTSTKLTVHERLKNV